MTNAANPTEANEKTRVRSVTPCLTFKDQAEEAVTFYVSLFANSKIVSLVRSENDGPIPKGKVLNVAFELNGQAYTAFDGGAHFTFSEGMSLVAICETQKELDEIWQKLSSHGGQPGPCGWLKDRFGVSWQIVPAPLMQMMAHPEKGNSKKVMEALMKMGKLDIAALESAYQQA
jgi:predicted 3-demethylubiquinone-9 3-methyltransferase (glyoxalase superfamily)